MTESLSLTTVLEPRGPAAAVVLTDEQVAALGGGKKTFPVTVTIGAASVGLRVARVGGESLVGLSKAARTSLGVETGQTVDVTITVDDSPREVEVPPELAKALAAQPDAQKRFDALAYSIRKEHARSVASAKKPETRDRRVATIIAALTDNG